MTSVVLAAMPQEVTGGPLIAGVLALAPLLVSIGGAGRLPSVIVALGFVVTLGFVVLIALAPRAGRGDRQPFVGRAPRRVGPVVRYPTAACA